MLTVPQLKAFSGGAFNAAGTAFSDASQALSSASSSVDSAGQTMGQWEGPAASAAEAKLSNAGVAAWDATSLLQGLAEIVDSFVAAVLVQQDACNQAVQQVTALPWPDGAKATVNPDGSVTMPPAPLSSPAPSPGGQPPSPAAVLKANQDLALYQQSSAKVPGLQRAIHDALHAATQADSRAQGDLAKGAKGASDFTVTLVQGVGSSQASDLYGLSDNLSADATAWSQQLGDQAAKLAGQAAGSPTKAQELQNEYGALAKSDTVFSTRLLNDVGPQGLLKIANDQGNADVSNMGNQPGGVESPADMAGDKALYGFLYTALATGTAGTGASGDPGAVDHVSSSYFNQLSNAGQNKIDGEAGYWGLSQILGAASKGDPPPSTSLLTTVGGPMIGWARDNSASDIGPDAGVLNLQGNPLTGLLSASALNPTGAQALLLAPLQHADGSTVTGSDASNNLSWLIQKAPWAMYSGGFPTNNDGGAALGQAIAAAGDAGGGNTPQALQITSQTIHDLGQSYAHDSSFAQNISGIDPSIATLLANHIGSVNATINQDLNSVSPTGTIPLPNGAGPGASFAVKDLAEVTGNISQDPGSYTTLTSAQVAYMKHQLNAAAGSYNPNSDNPYAALTQASQNGSETLAFLGVTHSVVGQDGVNAALQGTKQDALATTIANQVLGDIPGAPVLKIPIVGLQALQDHLTSQINNGAGQIPTQQGATVQLSIPDTANQLLINTILQHQLYSGPSPTDYANQPGLGRTPFTGPDGQLLDPTRLNAQSTSTMNEWLQSQKGGGGIQLSQQEAQSLGQNLGGLGLLSIK